MELLELMQARYSLRKYTQTPVEEEKLQRILQAGACAPTAKNRQPQHIYVLKSQKALETIRGITACAFDAPVVLLICGDVREGWVNPFNQRNATEMDCSIINTHMMLEAQSLGLGSCWVCWFDTEEVKKQFALPDNHEPFALLPLGYPAEDAHPSKMHDFRKPLSETVTEL